MDTSEKDTPVTSLTRVQIGVLSLLRAYANNNNVSDLNPTESDASITRIYANGVLIDHNMKYRELPASALVIDAEKVTKPYNNSPVPVIRNPFKCEDINIVHEAITQLLTEGYIVADVENKFKRYAITGNGTAALKEVLEKGIPAVDTESMTATPPVHQDSRQH